MSNSIQVFPDDPTAMEARFHPPADKAATGLSALTAQGTATVAAGSTGVRHVATGAVFSMAASNVGMGVGTLGCYIIDGASGGSTYLWREIMQVNTTGAVTIRTGPISIAGSSATALTAEFSAGFSNGTQMVTLTYHDIGG